MASEGCATNRQHSKSNFSLAQRGQLEELNVGEPFVGQRSVPDPAVKLTVLRQTP